MGDDGIAVVTTGCREKRKLCCSARESSKAAAERSLDAVLHAIKRGVKSGSPVQLVGFGTFRVSKRAARLGRNPKTGEQIQIKASKTVRFASGSKVLGLAAPVRMLPKE